MLAAMMLHGVNPGPLLFLTDPSMVYTIFAEMIIANLLMIGAGIGVAQFLSTLMRTPPAVLAALIVVLRVMGAYWVRHNLLDFYGCLVLGVLGCGLNLTGIPPPPPVTGA